MRLNGSRRVGAALFVIWLCGVGGAVAQSNLPPGSIPLDDAVDSGDPAALVVRIDRLEDELRRANGQIEELQNQNLRLQEQFKRFREDVEFRLSGAKPAGGVAPPPPVALSEPPPVAKPRKGDAFDPGLDPNAPGAPRVIGSTAPSAPLGAPLEIERPKPIEIDRPKPLGIERPTPLGGAPKPAEAPPTIVTSGLDFADRPKEQFNAAVEAYKAGQYADAEAQLKAFLSANSTHRLAPDAIFFLGETYLQRLRPREAAEQYLKLSTDFSRSTRAPDGMMRLGQSLAMLGNSEQACATFAEVGKRYPTASSTVRKTVEREMQKDHC
jgi:tol-pal system protein YbgF